WKRRTARVNKGPTGAARLAARHRVVWRIGPPPTLRRPWTNSELGPIFGSAKWIGVTPVGAGPRLRSRPFAYGNTFRPHPRITPPGDRRKLGFSTSNERFLRAGAITWRPIG